MRDRHDRRRAHAARAVPARASRSSSARRRPWTVMSVVQPRQRRARRRSRGELLTDVLRDEWGFAGLVMTRLARRRPTAPRGLHAGLDLEMPSSTGAWDDRVVERPRLRARSPRPTSTCAARRVVELALRVEAVGPRSGDAGTVDLDAHHALARRAAAAGAVLLTNDGTLPLAPPRPDRAHRRLRRAARATRARAARWCKPTRLDAALDAMRARLGDDADLVYAPGYDPASRRDDAGAARRGPPRQRPAPMSWCCWSGCPPSRSPRGSTAPRCGLPDGHETARRGGDGREPAHRRGAQQRRRGRGRRGPTGPPPCSRLPRRAGRRRGAGRRALR